MTALLFGAMAADPAIGAIALIRPDGQTLLAERTERLRRSGRWTSRTTKRRWRRFATAGANREPRLGAADLPAGLRLVGPDAPESHLPERPVPGDAGGGAGRHGAVRIPGASLRRQRAEHLRALRQGQGAGPQVHGGGISGPLAAGAAACACLVRRTGPHAYVDARGHAARRDRGQTAAEEPSGRGGRQQLPVPLPRARRLHRGPAHRRGLFRHRRDERRDKPPVQLDHRRPRRPRARRAAGALHRQAALAARAAAFLGRAPHWRIAPRTISATCPTAGCANSTSSPAPSTR